MTQHNFIQVLGTAQDGGYPQIGCNCHNCKMAKRDSTLIRLPSSLGIFDTASNKSYIIDATPALPQQLELLNTQSHNLGISSQHLDGILLTHAHLGHYTGLMYLGKEALNTNNLKIYCTSSMGKFLANNAPWSDLINNSNIMLINLDLEKTINLTPSLSIKAIPVPHRNEHADTVGFIIEGKNKSAFYLPDFDYWKDFMDRFNRITKEVDYIFLDGTFYDKDELSKLRSRAFEEVPHPPISTSIRLFEDGILKKNKSKIYFTHFNHTNRLLSFNSESRDYVNNACFSILSEGECFEI